MLNMWVILSSMVKNLSIGVLSKVSMAFKRDKEMRAVSVSVLNALQRLVVVVKNIDAALVTETFNAEQKEQIIFARNALCLTCNIWSEHLSGNMNKLYKGLGRTIEPMSPDNVTFYEERMPRSIAFAKKALMNAPVNGVKCFLECADEIAETLVSYACVHCEVATYLKDCNEDLDDIPMLNLIDANGEKQKTSISLKSANASVNPDKIEQFAS